jgi:dihydroorotate dehydrogenase (NAD+) catalytic subunit
MLNSIGLENVGLEGFLRDKLPALRKLSTRVIVSIGGDTVREYAEIARRIDGIRGIDGLEVNISCPNVRRGGMAFGADPKITHRILSGVRRATSLPAIAKLTPNVTAIEPIARAAEDAGVDGLSLINTLQGLCIDTETRCSRLGGFTGGLSGPAIRPVAVAMVFRVHQAVKIPVIGIGGIMTPADALEFMIAGASAIQVGTGNFVDPRTPVRVVEGLTDYCRRHQIKRLRGIVGTLQSSRASCL